MLVKNKLLIESLMYTADKKNMLTRTEEIGDLIDIENYCSDIDEYINIDEDIWEQNVEEGVSFMNWLFSKQGIGNEDDRARILEFINRNPIVNKREVIEATGTSETIEISLGEYDEAAYNEKQYIKARRNILSDISNVEVYVDFMPSCFKNSCFSDDILSEMKYISDFETNTKEITECLSVLNDEAVRLYREYRTDLKQAMRILTAKITECSTDPKHRKSLYFSFTYEEKLMGEESVCHHKSVLCEPHLKLNRRDSDLRIYFQWKDEDVGKGEKVLVGRIGRHPY